MERSQIAARKSQIVVAIVGGGPAGSSLAIRLAQNGFETVLIEKEKFPRQKLCGEFISPECLGHFDELGVLDRMMAAGGDRIYETRFFATGGRSVAVPSGWLAEKGAFALSLSRAEMDLLLLERAKEVGVDVREGTTLIDLELEKRRAVRLITRSDDRESVEVKADLFVDATGRAAALGRLVGEKPYTKRPAIVGFKAHVAGIELERGVCEMYSFPGGYAGLSHVEGGQANLCFLIKSEIVRSLGNDARTLVDRVVIKNLRAAETLRTFSTGDWLAVSINGFGTQHVAAAANIFSVGDAAAFIDPFTGSGMVMAMQSADILAGAIQQCWGSLDRVASVYATDYDRRFSRRLRVCSVLRRSAFMPRLATAMVATLGISSSARRILARSTRG